MLHGAPSPDPMTPPLLFSLVLLVGHSTHSLSLPVAPSCHVVPRDIVIIGGGLAGLSIAHHIASTSSRHVTLVDRDVHASVSGSLAAAGMLAPHSERLPPGPLLDLCLASRHMYSDWVAAIEHQSESDVGYRCTGGFLAPAFAGCAVATWAPFGTSALWLDQLQIREMEPLLHPHVVGGWWFPEDASVDARRLTNTLRACCASWGVHLLLGSEYEVLSLDTSNKHCTRVHLANGNIYSATTAVLANGAWMRHLFPTPIQPHKGQSLSLRPPANSHSPLLNRVLFAQDTYIVPKADGRIIVGATVEPGKYDGDITPAGIMHCLSEATRLVPALKDCVIEETWAGLRPTTPDKCPILGKVTNSLFLAGGYWRNGVLLAPKTGQLMGDWILRNGDPTQMTGEDQALLQAFSWERFTDQRGGTVLAANARFAAAFSPVHKRSTEGVATAVGTELGFYEGAAAAKGERERERRGLFEPFKQGQEEKLEHAAKMGVRDAQAFTFQRNDEEGEETMFVTGEGTEAVTLGMLKDNSNEEERSSPAWNMHMQTETIQESDGDLISDLPSLYEKIKANKAKAMQSLEMGEDTTPPLPNLPFRIYHVDKNTRELTMVPPYTSPGEFFQMKAEGKLSANGGDDLKAPSHMIEKALESVLRSANHDTTKANGETVATKEKGDAQQVREKNRRKTSEIDESVIGAKAMQPVDDFKTTLATINEKNSVLDTSQSKEMSIVESNEKTLDGYQDILNANSATSREVELQRMKEARMKNRAKGSDLGNIFEST